MSQFLFDDTNYKFEPGQHYIDWKTLSDTPQFVARDAAERIPSSGPCKLILQKPNDQSHSSTAIIEELQTDEPKRLELKELNPIKYPQDFTSTKDILLFTDNEKYEQATLRLSLAFGMCIHNCHGTLMLYGRVANERMWVYLGNSVIHDVEDAEEDSGEEEAEEEYDEEEAGPKTYEDLQIWLEEYPHETDTMCEALQVLKGLTIEDVRGFLVKDLEEIGMGKFQAVQFRKAFLKTFK